MIRVLRNYGSVALGKKRIEPGDYAEDDPRLFGQADYLVANGHAVDLSAPSAQELELEIDALYDGVEQEDPEVASLDDLNKDEIRERLDELGITYNARRSADSLRELLKDNV
jgi:hypothetical protein